MKLLLNGNVYDAPEARLTVAQLLDRLKLAGGPVAVEVNKKLVPRRQHAEANLGDGDVVEVVTLVGGG